MTTNEGQKDANVQGKVVNVENGENKKKDPRLRGEFIYLIRLREHFNNNMGIYKIGRTSQELKDRLCNYPFGSKIYLAIIVDNSVTAETELLREFDKRFIKCNDKNTVNVIGDEYYIGNVLEMISVILEYQKTHYMGEPDVFTENISYMDAMTRYTKMLNGEDVKEEKQTEKPVENVEKQAENVTKTVKYHEKTSENVVDTSLEIKLQNSKPVAKIEEKHENDEQSGIFDKVLNFFSSLSTSQTNSTRVQPQKADVPKNSSIPKLPLNAISTKPETLSPKVSTFSVSTPNIVQNDDTMDVVTPKTTVVSTPTVAPSALTFHNYIDRVLTKFTKKVNDSILFVTTFPSKYEVEIREILVYDRFTGTLKHIIDPETVNESNKITITKMLQSKIDNRKLTRSITNNTVLFTVPKLFRQKIPGKNIRCYFIDVHPPTQRNVLVRG